MDLLGDDFDDLDLQRRHGRRDLDFDTFGRVVRRNQRLGDHSGVRRLRVLAPCGAGCTFASGRINVLQLRLATWRRQLVQAVLLLVARSEECVAIVGAPPLTPKQHGKPQFLLILVEMVIAKVVTGRRLQCLVAHVANFLAVTVQALDEPRRLLQITHQHQRATGFKANPQLAVVNQTLQISHRAAIANTTEYPAARTTHLRAPVGKTAEQCWNGLLAGLRQPKQVIQQLFTMLILDLIDALIDLRAHQ